MTELIASIHLVSSVTLVVIGLIQLTLEKGGLTHAITGLLFLATYTICLASSFGQWPLEWAFALSLGLYLALTGWRFASKRSTRSKKPDYWLQWISLLLVAVYGYLIYQTDKDIFSLPGAIMVLTALTSIIVLDLLRSRFHKTILKSSKPRAQWFFNHITRMPASYFVHLTIMVLSFDIFRSALLNGMIPSMAGLAFILLSRPYYARIIDDKGRKVQRRKKRTKKKSKKRRSSTSGQ